MARGFDQALRDFRTHDNQKLTEGEVMAALGFLIGQHCKDADRVHVWCRAMQVIALHENAAKLNREK